MTITDLGVCDTCNFGGGSHRGGDSNGGCRKLPAEVLSLERIGGKMKVEEVRARSVHGPSSNFLFMGKLNSQNKKSIQSGDRLGKGEAASSTDGVRQLKIYEEADKIDIQSRCKAKSGALNTSDVKTSRKSLKVGPISLPFFQSDIKNVEKIKEKCSTSVKIFVKRKVLTDISNIRGNSLRTKSHNSSKLVKADERCGLLLEEQEVQGNVRSDFNGAAGDKQILTRGENFSTCRIEKKNCQSQNNVFPFCVWVAPFKDTNASVDEPKTKIQGRKSVTIRIRRSLPILQQVNVEGMSNKKKGNLRPDLNGAAGDKQILAQAPFQDMKAPFDGTKTKTQGRKSVTIGIRTTGRNALPPSRFLTSPVFLSLAFSMLLTCLLLGTFCYFSCRRSLPVLEQESLALEMFSQCKNCESVQDYSKELEKGKGISGVPVSAKLKAAGDVLPQLSNHNNIRRNRVSDASARMVPKGHAKAEIGALRRKSVKTVLKTTASSLNSQTSSKMNSMSDVHKCTSQVAIPCKRLEDVSTSSLSKYATSDISAEQPHQKVVASSSSGSLDAPECSIARRKSDRRKSFTCLLMARSKEQCGGVKLEDLSHIHDNCNHLDVTEYVDDIYLYYWVIEAQNQPIENYMEIQKEITPQMRGILINWLIEVHLKFDLMQETLFLMVTLLDYYLSLARVKKNDLQLVGLTSLLLASKYEDLWHPRVNVYAFTSL
ncbi:putative DCN1-like protein 1-like [Capsicum annuum]|nr:putative DCN1-like protein 1-like [Capsicum annuum]